jgi:FKBP-type peptidyl-prolyl cis-trans isomerase 2
MIAKGSKVSIHYTLTVDGSVVDSSRQREPLTYVQGEGQLVPGVEAGLAGAAAGDVRKLSIPPAEGYGETRPELMVKAPKQSVAHLEGLAVGAVVRGEGPQGEFRAVVKEIGEAEITLDLNHPLAGKTLEFDIEVVAVEGGEPGAPRP